MQWHYSRRMPIGRLVCQGVWESERFVGVVMYGRGASPHLGKAYGVTGLAVCELVRIALAPGRQVPTSRVLAASLRLLAKRSPDLQLVMSFADPAQGHVGTLYQATNWLYAGTSAPAVQYLYKGRWCHTREVSSGAFGQGGAVANLSALPTRTSPPKHRYLYPLTAACRARLAPHSQPYPKKSVCADSIGGDARSHQLREGGATPTSALHHDAEGSDTQS